MKRLALILVVLAATTDLLFEEYDAGLDTV